MPRAFTGQTFTQGQRVPLDDGVFINCTFQGAVLAYAGSGLVRFDNCTFENITWTFEGPSVNVINFLQYMYHAHPIGKMLVESLLNIIKTAPGSTMPIPAPPSPAGATEPNKGVPA